MDPKLSWALAHRDQFPVDVNTAPKEMLLRIPGIGVKSVNAILTARRHRRLRMDDLARLRLPLAKISAFVTTAGHEGGAGLDSERLRARLTPSRKPTVRDPADSRLTEREAHTGLTHGIVLAHEVDWGGWRDAARRLILDGVPPERRRLVGPRARRPVRAAADRPPAPPPPARSTCPAPWWTWRRP